MHWRTRDLLQHHGPRALTIGSIVIVVTLISLGPSQTVPGYAEVAPVRVASLESGRLLEVKVTPGDLVDKGDVIAVLDDGPIVGRIRVLQAELQRHGAALEGVERTARTALRDAEAARQDTATQLRAAREALRLTESQVAELETQVSGGLAARSDLAAPRARAATLRGEVDRLSARLQHRQGSLLEARAGIDTDGADPAPAILEQARALGVVDEELTLLEQRQADMTLRAPLPARIGAVNYRAGEVLPAQSPLAELLPLETATVVACVPEQLGIAVQAGGAAELYPADGGVTRAGTIVDVVGLVSEAPDRCKQRPNEIGWVRPVRIEVDGGSLVPGQRFEVTFRESAPAADGARASLPSDGEQRAP